MGRLRVAGALLATLLVCVRSHAVVTMRCVMAFSTSGYSCLLSWQS